MKRRRLAKGIYRDTYGISVVWFVQNQRHEQRFARDDSLERLIAWRKSQIAYGQALAPRDPRGSLARDVVRFLKTRKGRANYKTEKSNLKAWIRALDNPRRWRITRQQLEETIAAWRVEGYSEQTLRHRVRTLRQLFRTLDGSHVVSPFDDLALPKKSTPRPVSVADDLIRHVATELLKHEILKWLKDSKTRARFLVAASTGHRPSEIKRARQEDVDLARRLWFVRTAKGGVSTVLHLNDDMHAAWSLFVEANAWGPFDTRNWVRVLRRCGWPKGIRPYALRHSVGLALSERGADLGDIQAHLGHASIDTTRRFYVPQIDSRRVLVSELLERRLGPLAFPRSTSTASAGQEAKAGKSTPQSDHAQDGSGPDRPPGSHK